MLAVVPLSVLPLWVAYGVTISNWYLVVPNAVAFTVGATTIAVALRYRLKPERAGRT